MHRSSTRNINEARAKVGPKRRNLRNQPALALMRFVWSVTGQSDRTPTAVYSSSFRLAGKQEVTLLAGPSPVGPCSGVTVVSISRCGSELAKLEFGWRWARHGAV
jgi:hypothetical protein